MQLFASCRSRLEALGDSLLIRILFAVLVLGYFQLLNFMFSFGLRIEELTWLRRITYLLPVLLVISFLNVCATYLFRVSIMLLSRFCGTNFSIVTANPFTNSVCMFNSFFYMSNVPNIDLPKLSFCHKSFRRLFVFWFFFIVCMIYTYKISQNLLCCFIRVNVAWQSHLFHWLL